MPLPDYAARFVERTEFGRGDLVDAIIADIRKQITITVLTTDFKPEQLPAHHFMNFKIVDEHGRQLDMGRNLATLQAEYGVRNPNASRYTHLTFDKVLTDKLNVMDATAIVMCRDNRLPLRVFNLNNPGDLTRIVRGENVGTAVTFE